MKTLIVQRRLPYQPQLLNEQAGPFLRAIQQVVREAKEQHQADGLELSDIGFIPGNDYIEVKLYFRLPAEVELTIK